MAKSFYPYFYLICFLHFAVLLINLNNQHNDLLSKPRLNLQLSAISEYFASQKQKIIPTTPKTASRSIPRQTEQAIPDTQALDSAPSTNEAQLEDVRSSYKERLRLEIEKNKFYPPISQRLGQTGLVIVAFTLLEDGSMINLRIDTPSPFDRLNQAALMAVRKVGVYEPIPGELMLKEMDIRIPINFKI